MTYTLKKPFYFDNSPRKRCKYSGEFSDLDSSSAVPLDSQASLLDSQASVLDSQASAEKKVFLNAVFLNPVCKRRKLDEIYENQKNEIEQDIQKNIDQELLVARKRRKTNFSLSSITFYDEETVKNIISIALETQKEKLFESFMKENAEDIQHYEKVIHSLFDQHTLQNSSLADSYIG